jgi:acyl-[acyl-carrier-protein]-phospholipid O-acyltransferase / long-chain-fatty-acid--[acyl-carrier-protein] ligase
MLEKFLVRPLLTLLLKLFFRVEVHGREHYHAAGERVLIIVNHLSYLEPLIVGVFLPQKPAYAINVFQAEKWYLNWLDKPLKLYRLDPSKPLSMKRLIQDLRKSAKVVIFPEGRISTSGGIMKIYDGAGMIVEKTGATILPVRIDGSEYSKFSSMQGKFPLRWFPKIRLTFLPPIPPREGQAITASTIYDIMTEAAFTTSRYRRPVLEAVIEAKGWHGGSHAVACDITRANLTYRQLFTRAFILSDKLAPKLAEEKYIGVMLPTAVGAVVTFTGLHMMGKIPCMLNFSAGEANVLHACQIATIRTILTSRSFIEKGKLEALVEALGRHYTILYLEDIRPTLTKEDKISGLCKSFFPHKHLKGVLAQVHPDDPAVILYTSGSEGTPKGVALSHANLLGNIAQVCARLDLTPKDILFNAMPVFHSFGLTVGMLMPLVRGIKTFLYPTPLHYRIIPELVYDTDATIMLGTDTFYNGYAHYAHPYDFWKIRLAVAGAEKLKEPTRRLYSDTFRVNIIEGYGVTESSPVLSVNTPMENTVGTVGRLLPAVEYRIEPVEGLERGGRLFVKGPNIMLGYLKADKPGVIQPQGEWYDTGDIVDIDERGFLSIQGRAKRFAKIAGEMVSLQAVEDLACGLAPGLAHAAIAVPDSRKGEQVLLYTESAELSREQLMQYAKTRGVAEICLPRQVIYMEAVPRLGNGKIDYVSLSRLAVQ